MSFGNMIPPGMEGKLSDYLRILKAEISVI